MPGAAHGGYAAVRTGHSSIPIHRTASGGNFLLPTASRLVRDAGGRTRTRRRFRTSHAPTIVWKEMEEARVTAIDSDLRELHFG